MQLQLTQRFIFNSTHRILIKKIRMTTLSLCVQVVIGDQDGVVTCFGVSKGVSKVQCSSTCSCSGIAVLCSQTVFKTLPGAAISNLRLGKGTCSW